MRCGMARKRVVAGLLAWMILALLAWPTAAQAVVTTGSLCVNIYPPSAVSAGAQWRRTGTTLWFDSGTTETGIAAATHMVEFKPAPWWREPGAKSVTVLAGQTAVTSGTYLQQNGAVRVTITPPEAVAAGAQWRRARTSIWRDSGTSDTGALLGSCVLEFKETPTWSIAAVPTVTVLANQITDVNVSYAPVQAGMAWGTYLGGPSNDYGYGIAVDATGDIYVTGSTVSSGWASGGPDTSYNGGYNDAFVAKISSGGQFLWSTYLGGSSDDIGRAIALDGAGHILVCGYTRSPGWIAGGYDTSINNVVVGGYYLYDGFLCQLSPSGQTLWSTYLGGDSDDYAYGVAADSAGNCYVTGYTTSSGWTTGGPNTTYGGGNDAFLVKVSPTGQHLWSTYLGGSGSDTGYSVKVDANDDVCVAGSTSSAGWTAGGYDTTFNGVTDGFIAKLKPDGQPVWSTYLGGSSSDTCYALAVDGSRNVYVAGITWSSGWVSGGGNVNYIGAGDGFVAKFSPAGQPVWSSYLGGSMSYEYCYALAVSPAGDVATAGYTRSPGWVAGGFNTTNANLGNLGFVAVFSAAGQSRWSSYLGENATQNDVRAIAYDLQGHLLATGSNYYLSSGLPSTWLRDGFDTTTNGNDDSFVVKINPGQGSLGLTLEPPAAVAGGAQWRPVGAAAWLDSGTTTGLPAGSSLVEFKPVAGWRAPATLSVTIRDGQLTQTSATYAALPKGSLAVTLSPPEAVAAGAQWRRVGTTAWLDSGTTETGITSGTQTVEFKPITGWRTPANLSVTVTGGQTLRTSATYQQTGILRVTLTPPEAIAEGAKWRRAGTTAWLDSGTSDSDALVGNCILEFKETPNWSVASVPTVTVLASQVTSVTVAYGPVHAGLAWGTYLGGGNSERAWAVTTDPAGNIYVAGDTNSGGWVSGGYKTTFTGPYYPDAYVVKLSPSGQHLWSTFLGGTGDDCARGIALDRAGNIGVCGYTASDGWLSGGYDVQRNTASTTATDGFLLKLSPLAGQPLWGTYLGGDGTESALALDVDTTGSFYVAGVTDSGTGFISGGHDTAFGGNGKTDGFLVKITPAGQYAWGSYLGAGSTDSANAVKVDPQGNIIVGGNSSSGGWTGGGYDTSYNGQGDAFVAKYSPDGKRTWSTFIGGPKADICNGLAVDPAGNIYAVGNTSSAGWVAGGFDTTLSSSNNGFVAKLSPDGQLVWSTYLGGTAGDYCDAVALGSLSEICVTGHTYSAGWLTGGFDTSYTAPDADSYIAVLDAAGRLRWGALLGEGGRDYATAIACDRAGNPIVAGYMFATDTQKWFSGGFDSTMTGPVDAFVVKVVPRRSALKMTLHPLAAVLSGARWRPVGAAAWLDSGATTTGLMIGANEIEFKPLAGWCAPANMLADVGLTTASAAAYYYPVGSLRVTIAPPAAVAAGAQWRRVGTAAWLDSGTSETAVAVGNYSVEFKPLAGWLAPAPRQVRIDSGALAQTSATYAQVCSIRLTLLPPEAVAAGAKWRRAGTTAWLESGATETSVTLGTYNFEFTSLPNWKSPSLTWVLSSSGLSSMTLSYFKTGSLRVTIAPPQAVAAGARWRLAGTTLWRDSGFTETGLGVGSAQIEFKPLGAWQAPPSQPVLIPFGQTAEYQGSYHSFPTGVAGERWMNY